MTPDSRLIRGDSIRVGRSPLNGAAKWGLRSPRIETIKMRKGNNPMRTLLLLLLPLILLSPGQNSVLPTPDSSVVVLGFKSYKTRQAVEKSEPLYTGPAPAMT